VAEYATVKLRGIGNARREDMKNSFEEKVVDWLAAHPDRAQVVILLLLVGEQHILQLEVLCGPGCRY